MGSLKSTSLPDISVNEWHAKEKEDVLQAVGTTVDGLSGEEHERRQKTGGKNTFSVTRRHSLLSKFFEQFKSPLTLVLLLSCIVTALLHDFVDAIVIACALCIAIAVGIFEEGRAGKAFSKLAASQTHRAVVRREGKLHEIDARDLVVGDVVLFESGMQIPADVRLIEAKDLAVNEAVLTGEWLSVNKSTEPVPVGAPFAERLSMAFMGTFVAKGHGIGVVVAIGNGTEVGKIAKDLTEVEEEMTPLQMQMARISRVMFYIISVLVTVIFAIGLLRGEGFETMLITAIAIAVASVPEGLPAAVTIVLAIGMEALLTRGGLVRNLLAAETLGSTTYILTDKTGTLTENKMKLTHVIYGKSAEVIPVVNTEEKNPLCIELLQNALCASDAFIEEREEGPEEEGEQTYIVRGEPMERAILAAALDAGIAIEGEGMRAERVDYLSFTSENRFSAGVCPHGKKYRICVNGAPEYLLESATKVRMQGKSVVLSASVRKNIAHAYETLTKEGKRIIAVAYRDVTSAILPSDAEEILDTLVFVGLLVFDDPVRADVKEAIKGVISAGAQVRLVTGDNPATALTIAREVGIAREYDIAFVGKDIAELNDKELYEVLKTTRVFARMLPRQKLRLAQILQKHGEIVAMTGDGVNDAPALQKANIGIALGSGTEVAKEAADLVLVNDTFATIYAAIEEGRRIIGNLRKIVGYLLATSLSEAVLIIVALLVGAAVPIVPVQILWANIIEEGFMSVAFAFEPGDKNAMRERPQDIHTTGILSKTVLLFIILTASIMSILLVVLYLYLHFNGLPIEKLRSVMFLAVALDSLFVAFSFRSLRTPIWKMPIWSNRFFLGSFAVSLGMLAVVLIFPPLQKLLSYEPLPFWYVLLTVGYGFLSMVTVEFGKMLFFEKNR